MLSISSPIKEENWSLNELPLICKITRFQASGHQMCGVKASLPSECWIALQPSVQVQRVMTMGFPLPLHSPTCFIAIWKICSIWNQAFETKGLSEKWCRRSEWRQVPESHTSGSTKKSTKPGPIVYPSLPTRDPGTFTVCSRGMEPETVLWGPDLQGPEESQNEAHRGEGHKGLWAVTGEGRETRPHVLKGDGGWRLPFCL